MERTTRPIGQAQAPLLRGGRSSTGIRARRTDRLAIVALAAAIVVSTTAQAQTAEPASSPPDPRGNVRVNVGIGLASAGFGGDAGDRGVQREAGAFAHLGAGFAVGRRVHLGAEGALWAKESDGRTTSIRSMLAVVWVRPAADSGFWLKGGLGVIELDEPDIGNRGAGGAALLGAGYDIALGARTALAPWVQFTFSRDVEVIQNHRRTGFTEDPNLVQFGISFVWQ